MAAQDGLTFEGTFNHAGTGLFKDNTAGDIGADDSRALVTAIKESYLNRIDDAYTAPFPQVTASGTDTYTATLSPAITAYAAGQKFQILFTNANTGAATLNLNTVGAKSIVKNGSTALVAGDISAGQILLLGYDGTNLQIIGGGGSTTIVGVQDFFIPAGAMKPRVTDGCAELAFIEMATSFVNLGVLAFDQTVVEYAQFQMVPPRKWNNGTITVVPHWTAQAGAGTVRWRVGGGVFRNDDALTVALGTPQTSDDTLIATDDLHIGPETSAITLAGTGQDGNLLILQVSRDPGNDTLTGDALLIGLSVRFTCDAAIDA